MSFKLEWENSVNSQFQTIHRANEPFEADALPPVYAMVDKGVADFTDTAIEAFTPYFYRVASNRMVKGISEVVASRLVSGGFMGGPSLDLDFAGQAYAVMQPSGAMLGKNFGEIVTFTRASGGGRFNAAGQYEWLPANQPRINYDPVTGQCRGLLIEEQRTNLLTHSSDFANAVWGKSATTIAGAEPSLGFGLSRLIASTTTGTHRLIRSISSASGSTYTLSIFAKAGGGALGRHVGLFATGVEGASLPAVSVNLETGSLYKRNANTVGGVEYMGGGLYRLWIAVTSNSTSITYQVAALDPSNTIDPLGSSYAGDGVSGPLISAAQLETGPFPTSYIPTTTAQVTRAAEVPSVNVLSPWFNASEGTLFVDSVTFAPPVAGKVCVLLRMDGGASTLVLAKNNAGSRGYYSVFTGGGDVGTFRPDRNDDSKDALAYKAGSLPSLALDGVLQGIVSGSAKSEGLDPTRLQIGQGGGHYFNGHIRSIRYYPKRLSNTEIQAMTA